MSGSWRWSVLSYLEMCWFAEDRMPLNANPQPPVSPCDIWIFKYGIFYFVCKPNSPSFVFQKVEIVPWPGGSVGWSVILYPKKGWGVYSWSEHIARLLVPSPVGAHVGGNRSMFLTHINVSLSLSLSFFPLSLKWTRIYIFFLEKHLYLLMK